jgi:hypothetical protein
MKDALTVNFTIPAAVPTGEYLFRVEHIGLHVAQYVLGVHFSSYSGMSQEELLLVPLKALSPFIFSSNIGSRDMSREQQL